MEFLFELLFSVLGELLLQLTFEVLADLGLGAWSERAKTVRRNPVVAFFGYACLGAVAGGLSLLIFRDHLVRVTWLREVMVVIVPLLAGWLMSFIGGRREAKGGGRTRIESFANGFAFALAMALIRFFFAV